MNAVQGKGAVDDGRDWHYGNGPTIMASTMILFKFFFALVSTFFATNFILFLRSRAVDSSKYNNKFRASQTEKRESKLQLILRQHVLDDLHSKAQQSYNNHHYWCFNHFYTFSILAFPGSLDRSALYSDVESSAVVSRPLNQIVKFNFPFSSLHFSRVARKKE